MAQIDVHRDLGGLGGQDREPHLVPFGNQLHLREELMVDGELVGRGHLGRRTQKVHVQARGAVEVLDGVVGHAALERHVDGRGLAVEGRPVESRGGRPRGLHPGPGTRARQCQRTRHQGQSADS
ncbi:hypothetical protein D3C72_1281730 [compost metagenome]